MFVIDDVLLFAALASAATAAYTANEAAKAQAKAAEANTRENYRASENEEWQAVGQAGERKTDRMRTASQQLSMARVLAAEGAAPLRGRADNILASAAEDTSRMQASLDAVRGGIRQDQNATRVANDNAMAGFKSEAKAIRLNFFSEVAQAGMGAYAGSQRKASDRRIAADYTKDYRPDYSLSSGGRTRLGD